MAAYGDDAGFTAWLDAMGYTLPDGAPAPAVLRTRGSAYVDGYEPLWTGQRTDGVMQELGWPRIGASLNCTYAIPSDAIPPAVVNASYRAGWLDANSPGILSSSTTLGQRVSREKVDVIEVAYHNDASVAVGKGGVGFIDADIDNAMRQFICDDDTGAFIWSLGS